MDPVASYYDENAQYEWERFDRHPMEFAVTMRAFRAYLPPAPARVLDVGGGPGRYSIALAAMGYSVSLADISTAELRLAREQASRAGVELESITHADATDLSQFRDGGFDVVLLMGPLYHLLDACQRERAIAEAIRVAAPGGIVCAAFITRQAVFRDAVKRMPEAMLTLHEEWVRILQTGEYRRLRPEGGFTDAYFASPGEVRPAMEAAGLTTLDLIGVEGVSSLVSDAVNQLRGQAWDAWVDLMYRIGRDPFAYGAADHLLYLGSKPAPAE
jgi:S-adenosylmethionine-dependent methyltransferase